MSTMIVANDIFKSFGSTSVLRGISLEIQRGEVVAIIGPSGSGKSTFLRCLNHLETIDRGSIAVNGQILAKTDDRTGRAQYVNDRNIAAICSKMGMVFQSFNLFPHLTVLENIIEAPMLVKKMRRAEIEPKARELLRKVGLEEKAQAYPNRLSGGQKQRVAIARALAMDPEILLFDEPTSALDPELTGEVLRAMQELAQEKMTMLVVTHEMGFAREVADRVVFMDKGEVVEQAPAREFFARPQHARTQAFLQKML